MHKGGDGMFTVDELIEAVPGMMSGIVPVAPPIKMSEAVKASEEKKKAG